VLFDFGNTLFAHDPLADTIIAAAKSLGQHLEQGAGTALAERIDADAIHPDELLHPRDLDATVWEDRWKVLYGVSDETIPGLGAAIYELMHRGDQWRPYADVAAVLRRLRDAGVRVGIVSNTGWDIRTVFAHHDLTGDVDTFVLSCEVGISKPEPEIFRLAAERLGLDPATVVMIGDDPASDGGAVRAGMHVWLVPAAAAGADNGIGAVLELLSR